MEIDIVSYTARQLASMPTAKLQAVRSAQLKKNKLLRDLEENLKKTRNQLVDNGIFASDIWIRKEQEMRAACTAAITEVRESLILYLQYGAGSSTGQVVPENVPYHVDFSLSYEQRMEEVKKYYTSTYPDYVELFEKFKQDEFARGYLGELYAPLYHYFDEMRMVEWF